MGEVGGKRNDDGCKMERNSSMASEGSVDLDQPEVQQASSEEIKSPVVSLEISVNLGTYRGDARGDTERSRSDGDERSALTSSTEVSSPNFNLSNASEGAETKRTVVIGWGRCTTAEWN
ncbi:hypothetical protein PHLCEN_2v4569 [Hermanssonia centrifuga]|uniref:Uncharacterized protein n=1 Tax=Hermanssonia centrifuga TaxID=98765 RepID=A0A2R6PP76_9APHY|nr:hypothetical protein PHLCEN_2v4569 [Hermanssonia centrifuga]